METLYKSYIPGVSDDEFRAHHTVGATTFISYDRLMKESIGSNLRQHERIKGMIIDKDGIRLFLETKK